MGMLTATVRPRQDSPPGAYDRFIQDNRQRVRDFYDALGPRHLTWNRRFRYYRQRLYGLLRHCVPPGASVLDIGCGVGDVLDALEPRCGVGIDCSPVMVEQARKNHPGLTFAVGYGESLHETEVGLGPYEYVTLVNVIGEMWDIAGALRSVHRYCSPETRIIIVQYNYLWEPICRLAAKLRFKLETPTPNWLSPGVLGDFLRLGEFEVVRQGWTMPLPVRVPGLNWLFNSVIGRVNGLRKSGFLSYVIARPTMPAESPDRYSCSVVVPCKDEQDNIDGLVERIPEMGAGTEVVFVDDQSTDQTAARVRAAIQRYPQRKIRLVPGPGQGKGAACRAGFAVAGGDVFMILDADMTVMPEELPAFFEAITSGQGEFINGSRMVYPLEDQAMRTLNILGNKAFASLFSLVLDQRIRDTLCGTKVIWRRDYAKIIASRDYFGSCDRWGDYDWIFGAAKSNLKIVELPIHYRERLAGQTKMNRRLSNGWTMLRMCWLALRKIRLI